MCQALYTKLTQMSKDISPGFKESDLSGEEDGGIVYTASEKRGWRVQGGLGVSTQPG